MTVRLVSAVNRRGPDFDRESWLISELQNCCGMLLYVIVCLSVCLSVFAFFCAAANKRVHNKSRKLSRAES